MTVARFIAFQRTRFRVPHSVSCRLLGVSESWFYKWLDRAKAGALTATETRRHQLDAAVLKTFVAARGLHGSPRLHADLDQSCATCVEDELVVDRAALLVAFNRGDRRFDVSETPIVVMRTHSRTASVSTSSLISGRRLSTVPTSTRTPRMSSASQASDSKSSGRA